MKLNWKKHWFVIVNIISFCIAIIDGFVWRNTDTGFPVFMVLGTCIAGVIGGIYNLCLIFSSGYSVKKIVIELILLWFTFPFYGFIGAIGGLLIGFTIF